MEMNNREKLNAMYEHALKHALCCNRKTFAALIGISPANLSNALSENLYERYCTNGILNKANAALGYVFAPQWIQNGTGDMYAQSAPAAPEPEVLAPIAEESSVVASNASERVKHLESLVETLQAFNKVLQKDNKRLEQENEALKKANYSVSVARAKNA